MGKFKINKMPAKSGRNTPAKAKKVEPTKTTKRKAKRTETFSIYIYRVLKQVHPDTGISKRSMSIMNSFIHDIYEKVAHEASKLVRYNKKHTLSSREVQTAVRRDHSMSLRRILSSLPQRRVPSTDPTITAPSS